MISNFPTPKSYNLAGLLGFKFAPAEAFTVFSGIFDGKILLEIPLVAGFSWLNGYATAYTLGFTEIPKTNVHGTYYEQTVSGFLPGDKAELIALMQEMENQYFVLQVKNPKGINRLIGGYGTPMRFSASFDSGLTRSDGKGYQFQFYAESLNPAPVYL